MSPAISGTVLWRMSQRWPHCVSVCLFKSKRQCIAAAVPGARQDAISEHTPVAPMQKVAPWEEVICAAEVPQ